MVVTFPGQTQPGADLSLHQPTDHHAPVVTSEHVETVFVLQNNCTAALQKLYRDVGIAPGDTFEVGDYRITAMDIRQSIKLLQHTGTDSA